MARRTKAQIEAARKRSLSARKARLKKVHHMTLEQYEGLKAFQGGKCYLCQWATGKTKSLAVDHDHKRAREMCSHDPDKESCINCWRGLLCSPCNKLFGHARDAIAFFKRGIEYLTNPPARRFFNGD
jgi:Recombination endonuclease VII